jgi:probable F420-dependent oxidoreductase
VDDHSQYEIHMLVTARNDFTTFKEIANTAKVAEDQCYDMLLVPEITGDPFVHLAPAVMATEKIKLGTSVAVAFPRSPMVTASASWALHANSNGRFILGLGTQVKAHNVRRFSTEWFKPRARMREYVESMRAIWACWEQGEELRYEGEHYQFSLMIPEASPPKTGLPRIPVYIAAVKAGMQQSVASYADGIFLHGFCTGKYLKEVTLPAIAVGLKEGGQDRSQFDISGGGFVATGPNDLVVNTQRESIRAKVAFYGSTPQYRPVWSLHGWDDMSDKLGQMARDGQWAKMPEEISDDVLDHFCVAATWDDLPKAIEGHFGGMSDSIDIVMTGAEPDQAKEIIDKIRAIPSNFKGHDGGWLSRSPEKLSHS